MEGSGVIAVGAIHVNAPAERRPPALETWTVQSYEYPTVIPVGDVERVGVSASASDGIAELIPVRTVLPRFIWSLLFLSVAAVVVNLHPLQPFFDQQLMLGSSLAVLALLQFGWRGLVVGFAAYSVTWTSWGHPRAY